jgi:hypothetical protein
MDRNMLPAIDMTDNPTGCCPRFHPEGWDSQDLHFSDKLFVRAVTRSVLHVPINMGSVFARVHKAIDAAKARDEAQFIVLSRELSPWQSEHFFAVTKDVPNEEMARLSGDFRTGLFEGDFKEMPKWHKTMEDRLTALGRTADKIYFFYTTCPKCAKAYGKNYVVGIGGYVAKAA